MFKIYQLSYPKVRQIRPKIKNTTHQIKIRYLGIMLLLGAFIFTSNAQQAHATPCPDLRIVFARGSGGERWHDQNYLAFKDGLEPKLKTTNLNYEFIDLDYPAIGIGVDKLGVTARAYYGAGEAYEFGSSVNAGVKALKTLTSSSECSNTKYVLGGYSQGAMVVSKSLRSLKSDQIIYAATFGDPKIYLPEGGGLNPPACQGKNLSDYRIYVPDCHAYKGMLGAYTPYEPAGFMGKVGTWCNKRDIFCSSYLVASDHTAYVSEHLYDDAAKLIFSKIAATFDFKNEYTSPHDTAILIDSTSSMSSLIDQYKIEAMNLARQTLEAGGRVALYDYKDLAEDYSPVERCSFTTCTIETFQAGLDAIRANNGGDTPESLLSASFHVMKQLDWRLGSTKSLVILTDAGYHSPDLDGTTFYDVKKLSQQIDPVNFYIVTTNDNIEIYQPLAEATNGAVASGTEDFGLLTNTIMERFDSLPRVEEEYLDETYDTSIPSLSITEVVDNGNEATITFTTDAANVVAILNDAILGTTDQASITFTDLDRSITNTISLAPLSTTRRGGAVSITLDPVNGYGGTDVSPDVSSLFSSINLAINSDSTQNHPGANSTINVPNTGAPSDDNFATAASIVATTSLAIISWYYFRRHR